MPEPDSLVRGRGAYGRRAWNEARDMLLEANDSGLLAPEDLELLASASYMVGDVDGMINGLSQAHHLYLDDGRPLEAARTALWLGTNLASRGKVAAATGWISTARAILDQSPGETVANGYALLPITFQQLARGDLTAMAETAAHAAAIGREHHDLDLYALAAQRQGRALLRMGRVAAGLEILDSAMVLATGDRLSPVVTGLVYCGVIEDCYDVHEIGRAAEWTMALTAWCDGQPDLVAFTGQCLAHRAELMRLQGGWEDALHEAARVGQIHARGPIRAQALYQEAEILRVRGRLDEAEKRFVEVARAGGETMPGFALLRLDQGNLDAAMAAIERRLGEATALIERIGLLPAYVEIAVEAGDVERATAAVGELSNGFSSTGVPMHQGWMETAAGAVQLESGDAGSALAHLRTAKSVWERLGIPLEVARTSGLIGRALHLLGDDDSAAMEIDAARETYDRLGAIPRLGRLEEALADEHRVEHGLTSRELEVLELVASGDTNRGIAETLVLSERTIDRHVSNMLTKLGVASRTALTAYAYEHGLISTRG